LVIPLMVLLRSMRWGERVRLAAVAGAVGAAVYCLTNPYVPINLVRNPALVRANLGALGRAKAIVGQTSDIGALPNARRLIVEGGSMVGGVFGVTGILLLMFNRAWWREHARERVSLILLGAPGGGGAGAVRLAGGGEAGGSLGGSRFCRTWCS